jgi:hypothetical protein
MNFRGSFLAALCLAGPALSTVVAQLIHISVDMPDGHLLFKADDASIPWNTSAGFITQLDFMYDSQAHVGALDPGRNTWRMRVENPDLGQNFVITRPFQTVTAFDQGLTFEYFHTKNNVFEQVGLTLVFDSPIPTDGSLPKFPLPALGTTEFSQSQFNFFSGNSLFQVPHLAETYGSVGIQSITVTMTPVPEPSVYGLAALALVGAAIGVRRKKGLIVSS